MNFDKDIMTVAAEKARQEKEKTRRMKAEADEAELRLANLKQQPAKLDEILHLVQDIHAHVS